MALIRPLRSSYQLKIDGERVTFDQLAEAGAYYLGDPDTVARQRQRSLTMRRAGSGRR